VVDASFTRGDQRAPFVELAARLGLVCLALEVEAPLEVVRARLAERAARGTDASDADLAVYLRAREEHEPPEASEGLRVLHVDTSRDRGETHVAHALGGLLQQFVSGPGS